MNLHTKFSLFPLTLLIHILDNDPRKPASTEGLDLMEATKEEGILCGRSGITGNVLRFGPPMIINDEDVKFTLHAMDKAF